MNDLEKMEWFENAYHQYRSIKDVSDWKTLNDAAIFRKQAGDIDGAIEALVKAINLTKPAPNLAERTATMLNYLADLYLTKNESNQAENVLQESIELARFRFPLLLAANLWILGGIHCGNGKYQEALASAQESLRVCQEQGNAHGVLQAQELIRTIETKASAK